jgi:hypothetical protein
MSEPDAAPQTYGLWKLIGSADPTGKRAVVRCTVCGSVRTINHEAPTTSHVNYSGCVPPLNVDHHARSFASDLAAQAEGRGARKKQFGRGDG